MSWLATADKVKVVGTFHVPSTWNPGKSSTANGTAERAATLVGCGTAERACYFGWLRHGGACLLLWLAAARRACLLLWSAAARRSVPATLVGCAYDILLLVIAFRSRVCLKQSDIFEFDPHRLARVQLQRNDSFT
jgi:hypothetical protein